jgi:hypothetical protein
METQPALLGGGWVSRATLRGSFQIFSVGLSICSMEIHEKFTMIQFADTFGLIQVFNQVVRIDLQKAGPPARNPDGTQSNTPLLESAGELYMPIEGFLQAFGVMEQTLQKLAEAGILKRADSPSGAPAMQGMPGPNMSSASAGGKKKRS